MPGETARHNGKKGGRPKGVKDYRTIEKEHLRQLYLQHQESRLIQVADAQFELAIGVTHLMAQDPASGQWMQVTDPKEMLRCLNAGTPCYRLAAINPNVAAQKDFLDRLLDKPTEQLQVTGGDGGPLEIIVKKPW